MICQSAGFVNHQKWLPVSKQCIRVKLNPHTLMLQIICWFTLLQSIGLLTIYLIQIKWMLKNQSIYKHCLSYTDKTRRCEGSFVDIAWIGYMGRNHLPVCPLSNFLSNHFVQNPFRYYTNLFCYLMLYLFCIKCWSLHMSMSQNTYTILYRYCIHIFYDCCCFYHDLYFACYLLSGNSTCWL